MTIQTRAMEKFAANSKSQRTAVIRALTATLRMLRSCISSPKEFAAWLSVNGVTCLKKKLKILSLKICQSEICLKYSCAIVDKQILLPLHGLEYLVIEEGFGQISNHHAVYENSTNTKELDHISQNKTGFSIATDIAEKKTSSTRCQ